MTGSEPAGRSGIEKEIRSGKRLDRSALVGRLHAWFESMRVEGGYGGPVSHWWRHSLRYTGPGLDWRYEGIVHGYLNLYETTGRERWLDAAACAGRDLINGQLDSGNFAASAFERNPEFGGTPHEACASGALVRLARVCRDSGRDYEAFLDAARDCLEWHREILWRDREGSFSDTPGLDSFVPNKIASTAKAVLELARFDGNDGAIDEFVSPAMETVVDLQVAEGPRAGAIHQLDAGSGGDGRFFPLYISRCVVPLLEVGEATGEDRFVEAAVRAGEFLERVERPDGSLPCVVYESGDRNVAPRWIAGLGDMLRAYDALNDEGYDFDTAGVEEWLLEGFDECGAFRTAKGFGHVVGRGGGWTAEDVLHVVGWNDKAFRWLSGRVDDVVDSAAGESSVECSFRGSQGRLLDDEERVAFVEGDRTTYEWDKGSRWATWR